jgi:hypothetical protein
MLCVVAYIRAPGDESAMNLTLPYGLAFRSTGLRAQLLERIETLEEREREREREELLAKIIPAMEAWGHDTGAVKAVMDG